MQPCRTASTPRVGPADIPDHCRSRATSATRAASVALSAAAAASRRPMVCRSAAHAAEAVAVSSGAASSARIDGRSPNGRTAHSVEQCSEASASAQYESAGSLDSGSAPRCAPASSTAVHPSVRPRVPPRAPSVPERACGAGRQWARLRGRRHHLTVPTYPRAALARPAAGRTQTKPPNHILCAPHQPPIRPAAGSFRKFPPLAPCDGAWRGSGRTIGTAPADGCSKSACAPTAACTRASTSTSSASMPTRLTILGKALRSQAEQCGPAQRGQVGYCRGERARSAARVCARACV